MGKTAQGWSQRFRQCLLMLSAGSAMLCCATQRLSAETKLIPHTVVERPAGAIILIHGLWGDLESSFKHAKMKASWPDLLREDKRPIGNERPLSNYSIYLLKHSAGKDSTLSLETVIGEAVREFRLLALDSGIPRFIVIGHSFGGIIAKRLFTDSGSEIRKKLQAIFLFAVPSNGVNFRWADYVLEMFFDHPIIELKDRRRGVNWLYSREKEYRIAFGARINDLPRIYCAVEKNGVWVPWLRRSIKVLGSADTITYCSNPYPEEFDADHETIVKPKDRDDPIYKWFLDNFARALEAKVVQEQKKEAASAESATPTENRPSPPRDVGQPKSARETTVTPTTTGENPETGGRIRVVFGNPDEGERSGWYTPGKGKSESFRDCKVCPELVVVPAGRFLMGSPDGTRRILRSDGAMRIGGSRFRERGRSNSEGPQHEVVVQRAFAVAKYAVTRGEFEAFVRASGHKIEPGCIIPSGSKMVYEETTDFRNPGFAQVDDHPVVCVNWGDAKAYIDWLGPLTGKTYRLLSEAEREYVTRAGTQTRFWWGNVIATDRANYNPIAKGSRELNGEFRMRTVPVQTFEPNGWGLYNVHGNVKEWIADCPNRTYRSKPAHVRLSAAAWLENCGFTYRLSRGGAWSSSALDLRSAARAADGNNRFSNTGFRIAREIGN